MRRLIERDEDRALIAVTMTPEAGERFKAALNWFYCRVAPSDPPVSDKQRTELEHADWLRWGMSRIEVAAPFTTPDPEEDSE